MRHGCPILAYLRQQARIFTSAKKLRKSLNERTNFSRVKKRNWEQLQTRPVVGEGSTVFETEARTNLKLKATFRQKFVSAAKAQILATLMFSLSMPLAAYATAPAEPQFLKDVHKTMVDNNWDECAALGELYLRKHKGDPMGHAVKGYALLQKNDDDNALPHLNAAIKGGVTSLPSEVADSHANNLWSLRGYSLMRSGKLAEGIKDLEKSLEIKPRICLDLLNQRIDCVNVGAAYKKMGDAKKAASYTSAGGLKKQQYHQVFYPPLKSAAQAKFNASKLQTELRADPKSTILLCQLAAMQISSKNWGEAVTSLDKAIALEPYLMPARLLRYKALKKLKRNAEAKKDFTAIQETRDKAGVNVWAIDQKELDEAMRI